jgi:hypothetical protein
MTFEVDGRLSKRVFNVERVQHAINVLKCVARDKRKLEKFDMRSWASFEYYEIELIEANKLEPVINGCGTSACAMGWIASSSKARAAGLKLVRRHSHHFYPCYGGAFDLDAVQKYFGFRWRDTADRLFMPENYPTDNRTPEEVIKRLEVVLYWGEEFLLS